MSIISTWDNSNPMLLQGMADSQAASVVSSVIEEAGFEVCVCDGCEFVETAFAKSGGEWWQKDKKSFIFSKRFSADTITFSLLKDGVQQAVLNNSTYGDYYNFGSAFLINPNYKGFVIDWTLVQASFGYGTYVVRTVLNSLGTDYTYDSHPFLVVEYNANRANGSVRLEWYQSGSIMSGFDYTGIGWYQSVRIDGFFGKKTPNLELDYYQDTNRNLKQIRATNNPKFSLITHLLPSYIFDVLNEDAILANDIYVTDYNLLNQHLYHRFNIAIQAIPQVDNHNFSKRSNFVYEFTKKKQDVLKRNISGDFAMLPTQQSSTTVVELKTLIWKHIFSAGEGLSKVFTVDSDGEGVYTAISQDGSSGTIEIDHDGAGMAAFSNPLTLVAGETLQFQRSSTGAAGYIKITGEYE